MPGPSCHEKCGDHKIVVGLALPYPWNFHSQPFCSAMRMASTRLRAFSLTVALVR
jgi:hypothetical protein